MKDKNTNNSLKFNKFSFLAALDGLDTFFNLSIITYLSIFFFQNFDARLSIPITSFVVLLSFFSRNNLFCFLRKFLSKTKYISFNLYFFFSFFYFIPIILIQDFNIISLVIFILCRILVGNLFYLGNTDYFLSDQFKNENNFFIKYILVFISSMLVGTLVFTFFNDIFSNSQMNNWAWKCFYIFLLFVSLVFGFIHKYKVTLLDLEKREELNFSQKKINLPFSLKNICSIIPIFIFFIYSCENWLPRFSNPENMQLLDYGIVNIFLIIILILFIFPLFNLIGNKKLNNFVIISVILISTLAFLFEYTSSYSIDFLKFYLSIISSLLVILNFLNIKQSSNTNIFKYINVLSFNYLILSILTPLSFYFFINFSISYNIIYLIISMFFLVSFLAGKYGER